MGWPAGHAELDRSVPAKQEKPTKKERGHGRKAQREVFHVVGGSPELRGVPLIGTGPGGLDNTRPGGELGAVQRLVDEARELNEHAREIARQKMAEARDRLRSPTR